MSEVLDFTAIVSKWMDCSTAKPLLIPHYIERHLEVLFGYAEEEDGFIAFRSFADKGEKRAGKTEWVSPASIPGAAEEVYALAQRANDGGFAACVMPSLVKHGQAGSNAVTAVGAMVMDFDHGDIEGNLDRARNALGEPTLVIESGGTLADGTRKLHAYWRLSEMARGGDVDRVFRLNLMAARAFGGDDSFQRKSQPARLAGSLHQKGDAVGAYIIEDGAHEYELDDLAERIEALSPTPPARGEGNLNMDFSGIAPAKPPVGDTILNTVREGGVDDVTRFDALSRHVGFFLRRAHEGTITQEQAWQEIVAYNELKISPPWGEDRLRRLVQGIWDKHVNDYGSAKLPDPVIPVEADPANDGGSDTFPAELLQTDGALQALTSYINRTAIYPQPELALAASLSALGALMGRKVCGRTDLRTNVYTVGVAGSASGKNHARQVIKKAFKKLGPEAEAIMGGEEIASGQAVLSALGKNPSKLFQIDEFGLFLKVATNPKASEHTAKISRIIMQLFSDANTTHFGTDYANQAERPRQPIEQPNLCIHGTTTPETFWEAMGSGNVSDGSLARYLVFYSNHPDVRRNKAARAEPLPQDLMQALYSVLADIPTTDGEPYPVAYSEGALDVLDAFIDECDDRKIAMAGDSRQSIIGRMAEHAEKLAIIRAVSRNPKAPEISGTDMEWACALSRHCCGFMVRNIAAHVADNATERASNELLAFIKARGADGVTKTEIARKFRKIPIKDRDGHIHTLIEAQLVDQITHETGGKPATVYVAR